MSETLIDRRCPLCGWTGGEKVSCPTCGFATVTYEVTLRD